MNQVERAKGREWERETNGNDDHKHKWKWEQNNNINETVSNPARWIIFIFIIIMVHTVVSICNACVSRDAFQHTCTVYTVQYTRLINVLYGLVKFLTLKTSTQQISFYDVISSLKTLSAALVWEQFVKIQCGIDCQWKSRVRVRVCLCVRALAWMYLFICLIIFLSIFSSLICPVRLDDSYRISTAQTIHVIHIH